MLVRGLKRLLPLVAAIFISTFLVLHFYEAELIALPTQIRQWSRNVLTKETKSQLAIPLEDIVYTPESDSRASDLHREVYSASRADKKYFKIEFGHLPAFNPSIIPHPSLEKTWIIVGQQHKKTRKDSIWFVELVCNAVFNENGTLACTAPPLMLPIAATYGTKCVGDYAFFEFNIGPHDARVFYGPRTPYTTYGSNSVHTCFGQWVQDFRMLVDWGFHPYAEKQFRKATELQRPEPWQIVEKNWFLFWDKQGQVYAHYDVSPQRVFAKIEYDGSVGEDLAPFARPDDDLCMARYMPKLAPRLESIHQSTNSLLITLCERSDPSCEANDFNTFVVTIFQHKSYYHYHSVYEPYVMVFKQTAPFELYGISTKPIWIHGRGPAPEPATFDPIDGEIWNQTEMFYVASMSWKDHGQKYHGYKDDVLFLAFGVEDSQSGGIDIIAGDLFQDLGLCNNL